MSGLLLSDLTVRFTRESVQIGLLANPKTYTLYVIHTVFPYIFVSASLYKHRIPEAEKTIPLLYRLGICVHDVFSACQSAYKHHKR